MKTLYIECKMGAAGDMLMGALYELLSEAEKKDFLDAMNRMFDGDIVLSPCAGTRCGISGTHMHVEVLHTEEIPASDDVHEDGNAQEPLSHKDKHAHAHCSYQGILDQIRALPLTDPVKDDASAIYQLIGEVEAKVHNCPLEQIHFHEVGTMDALADVVGSCLLFHMLSPDIIYSSPVHVGNGTVRCAHGTLPVPAPATAEILKGIPCYTGEIQSELCTPTGAAILKHFVSEFIQMPVMTVNTVGIGLGTKEFPVANCVRIFLGEQDHRETDCILEISCNLDDMTGEELGYAMDVLLEAGAYDVFYESIHMKKNRPGILLCCFCPPSEKERFTKLIFRHTTTRGVRFQEFTRAKLTARFENVETEYGAVRRKISEGYGILKSKYEYEDLCRIAREQGISIFEVRNLLT